jgi:hypothetical protein
MNNRYELSEIRGAFHGNRRSVMQQKIMAMDQMSAILGSYLAWSYTSGARYGSDPTTPAEVSAHSQTNDMSCLTYLSPARRRSQKDT